VLKNVTFGYVPGKTVLKNINVTAKPGQKSLLWVPRVPGKRPLRTL